MARTAIFRRKPDDEDEDPKKPKSKVPAAQADVVARVGPKSFPAPERPLPQNVIRAISKAEWDQAAPQPAPIAAFNRGARALVNEGPRATIDALGHAADDPIGTLADAAGTAVDFSPLGNIKGVAEGVRDIKGGHPLLGLAGIGLSAIPGEHGVASVAKGAAKGVAKVGARALEREAAAATKAAMQAGEGAVEHVATNIAKRNLKKGSITEHSLRELSHADALKVAQQNHHLKQDATTGQYVGAPRGVNSPAALAKMRRDFDNQVVLGVEGGDWYPRAQGGIKEVSRDPAQADLLANESAHWSAQANPHVNLGFGLTAHNTYEAGLPQPIVHTGAQMRKYVAARDKGELMDLGPKTGVYEDWINPNTGDSATGTNDIWHARAFGFLDPDGSPLKRGLTAQEHAFLDAETVLAAHRANTKKLGGRTDWNIGSVQAAPWTYGKGKGLVIKSKGKKTLEEGLAEAAKTYPDSYDHYTAHAPYEYTPGAATGHAPEVLGMSYADRKAYGDAAPWTNAAGKDVLTDATNMYQRQVKPATGYFEGPKGTEVNPGEVTRPLVELTRDEGGSTVGNVSKKVLSGKEGFRALMGAQMAGTWNKMFPVGDAAAKASVGVSAVVPMSRPLTEAEMKTLAPLAEQYGMGLSDSGEGLAVMSLQKGPKTPKQIKAVLDPKHPLGAALDLLGTPERARHVGDYIDYTPFISAEHGALSGAELGPAGNAKTTNKMLSLLNEVPTLEANLDKPEVREAVGRMWTRDQGFNAHPAIQNARRIFATEGFAGLRAAIARGELLPATVAAIGLGSGLYQQQQAAPSGRKGPPGA